MTPAQPVTLTTAQGEPFQGFAAGDPHARGGVLLIHEWWGLRPHNRRWAERLAELGYRTLVIDLYDGRVTDDAAQASEWMRAVDQSVADAKLRAGLDELSRTPRKLATLGWSFGGRQALRAACLFAERVSAAVVYYSRMETDLDALRRLRGPVLGVFARQEGVWPEKMHAFEAAVDAAGKTVQSRSYDAGHGFIDPESTRYDPEAEKAAWAATVAFLDRHLR